MTQVSYPWFGIATGDAGPYTFAQWNTMYRAIFGEDRDDYGVIQNVENELAITISATGPPDTIQMDIGAAFIHGMYFSSDALETEVVPTSAAGTYQAVLVKNWSTQTVRFDVRIGASLTQTDGVLWEIPLATFQVDAAGNVTALADLRQFIFEGQQTVFLSLSMYPETTDGAEAIQTELTSGQPEVKGFAFDQTTSEAIQSYVAMPPKWDRGTFTYRISWTSTVASTDTVIWDVAAVVVKDGDPIDVAFGTVISVTDNAQGVANDQYITTISGALTVGGTPEDNTVDMMFLRIARDIADALAGDAVFQSIQIFYAAKQNDN